MTTRRLAGEPEKHWSALVTQLLPQMGENRKYSRTPFSPSLSVCFYLSFYLSNSWPFLFIYCMCLSIQLWRHFRTLPHYMNRTFTNIVLSNILCSKFFIHVSSNHSYHTNTCHFIAALWVWHKVCLEFLWNCPISKLTHDLKSSHKCWNSFEQRPQVSHAPDKGTSEIGETTPN